MEGTWEGKPPPLPRPYRSPALWIALLVAMWRHSCCHMWRHWSLFTVTVCAFFWCSWARRETITSHSWLVARRATYVVDGRFFGHFLVARRATYVVDGRFFGHFFWKVEGSSAHTRESRATHVCHMQLTCGKLLYGGGEPSHVAHVSHVWQLMCTLLLYGGGEPSRVAHVCHVWQLTCTLLLYGGGKASCVANVCHMCHVWQLACKLLLYGIGEPSHVAHVCHVWQLTCMLLLYGIG